MRFTTLFAAAATALVMSVSASQAQDLFEAASANPELSTFIRAVEAAGLTDTLKGEDPYTIFAPSNAAFEGLGNGVADRVIGDQEQIADIINTHIVEGEFTAADLRGANGRYDSLNGRVVINAAGRGNNGNGALSFEGHAVEGAETDATNGVLFVIDGVAH
jgi:uncharacterized surface protein with fasciclin (FAS1) repeats